MGTASSLCAPLRPLGGAKRNNYRQILLVYARNHRQASLNSVRFLAVSTVPALLCKAEGGAMKCDFTTHRWKYLYRAAIFETSRATDANQNF